MNKITLPYLNTRVETDILLTFILTPFWWITGFNIFIYQLTGGIVFVKLLMNVIFTERPLMIPSALFWYGLFLFSYLFSILINMGNHPEQRVLASFNNYLVFLMGFFVMIAIYNSEASFLNRLFKRTRILCAMTGFLAIFFLLLWAQGFENLETVSLMGRIFPGLTAYPFFRELLLLRITSTDWLITKLPRLAIYSQVHTALGVFMLMIIPLAMASYKKEEKGAFRVWLLGLLAFIPFLFALSRTVICAYIGAYVFVRFIEQKKKFFWALILLFIAVTASNFIYSGMEWLLRLRHQSTINRFEIYGYALQAVKDTNLLTGVGVRLREGRDEFLMMTLGSHSTYIGVLLVTGLMGLGLFLGFQSAVGVHWYRQKKWIQDSGYLPGWRSLGISYLGASVWCLTDTVDALPFIAYTYFVIIAAILLQGRILKTQRGSDA